MSGRAGAIGRRQAAEARRFAAAECFAAGVSQAETARRLGVSAQAVSVWHRTWSEGGPDALRAKAPGRKPWLSAGQVEELERVLRAGPVAELDRLRRALVGQPPIVVTVVVPEGMDQARIERVAAEALERLAIDRPGADWAEAQRVVIAAVEQPIRAGRG